MRRDEVLQLLAEKQPELTGFGVRSLALFGSVARDEAREDSDVDLVVELEPPATFDRFVELCFYLEELFGGRVDLLTRRSLRNSSWRDVIERDLRYVPGFSPVPA
jgi:predicted nucleotidyltransferase